MVFVFDFFFCCCQHIRIVLIRAAMKKPRDVCFRLMIKFCCFEKERETDGDLWVEHPCNYWKCCCLLIAPIQHRYCGGAATLCKMNQPHVLKFLDFSNFSANRCGGRKFGLFIRLLFCARHFLSKRQMFNICQAHSHALTTAKRRHKYSRGLSKL